MTEKKNPFVKYSKEGFKIILIDDIANEIIRENHIKTFYGKKSEEVYFYNKEEGTWETNGRERIETDVEELLEEHTRNNAVNEVLKKIKRLTSSSKKEFVEPIDKLCYKNGVLDVVKNKLLPFSPEYNFTTKMNIDYIPTADCPQIKKFINETFYDEEVPVIQEWFGFHLYKKHFIKKVMLVFGEKDTGKTIFLNLLTAFVGEHNKAGISLQGISKGERFVLAFLKDKFANIYDDLKQQDINDTGGMKMATGGGYVTGEYKFGDVFEFLIYAKNTFSCNKIPEIKITDMAYYDRFIPLPCDNVIPKAEQDTFLIEKLTSPEELSGLLNWALEGLTRLLKNSSFSYKKTAEEIKAIMEKYGNGLSAFCSDCLIKQEGNKITKETMFEMFKAYVEIKHLPFLNKEMIGRNLQRFALYAIDGREGKIRYWDNVGINPKAPKEVNDKYDTFEEIKSITQEKLA